MKERTCCWHGRRRATETGCVEVKWARLRLVPQEPKRRQVPNERQQQKIERTTGEYFFFFGLLGLSLSFLCWMLMGVRIWRSKKKNGNPSWNAASGNTNTKVAATALDEESRSPPPTLRPDTGEREHFSS